MRTGAVSSLESGSEKGWRVWDVTGQVAEMYPPGSAHGFVIFDDNEWQDSEQVYRSREAGSYIPTLVLHFREE
jgi:hypothetical protein